MNLLMPSVEQVEEHLEQRFSQLFETNPQLKSFKVEWVKRQPWEKPDPFITHINGFGRPLEGDYPAYMKVKHGHGPSTFWVDRVLDDAKDNEETLDEAIITLLKSLYQIVAEEIELDDDTVDAMVYVADANNYYEDKYRPTLHGHVLSVERVGLNADRPNDLSVELD